MFSPESGRWKILIGRTVSQKPFCWAINQTKVEMPDFKSWIRQSYLGHKTLCGCLQELEFRLWFPQTFRLNFQDIFRFMYWRIFGTFFHHFWFRTIYPRHTGYNMSHKNFDFEIKSFDSKVRNMANWQSLTDLMSIEGFYRTLESKKRKFLK